VRRTVDHRDPFWPAQLAILAAIILYLALPEKLTLGPSWLLPVFEGVLLFGLVAITPHPSVRYSDLRRRFALGLIGLVSAVNLLSLVLLAHFLLKGGKAGGHALILAGAVLWITNVLLFGLWFWELDRGGPVTEFLKPDAPHAGATGNGISLSPATSSEVSDAGAQHQKLRFPLYYPVGRVQSGGMPDMLRVYGIRDQQGHRHTAYRVVVSKGLVGDYYGIEGMDWTNPPIVKQPSELHNYGSRVLEYFYSGRHLQLIAWRTPHALYWLSNTLTDSLSNTEMIAVARAARPVR